MSEEKIVEKTVEQSEAKNEFEVLGLEDLEEVEIPADDGMGDFGDSGKTVTNSNIDSNQSAGDVYDYNSAPDTAKVPRVDLNGKTVVVENADIIIPPKTAKWEQALKNKEVFYKSCMFKVKYDLENQEENYSGFRVLKRDNDMYSHPSVLRDRKSQASALMGLYADFKGKKIEEVSLKEFIFFLKSKPKALIGSKQFTNPQSNDIVTKNIIIKFV